MPTGPAAESVVTIHGYEEHFAVNPKVKIFRSGVQIGEVGHHESFELKVEADCILEFTCSFRSAKASVRKGIDTHVLLAFDRFSGGLRASVANDTNLPDVRKVKAANATNAVIRAVGLIAVMLVLAWFALQGR